MSRRITRDAWIALAALLASTAGCSLPLTPDAVTALQRATGTPETAGRSPSTPRQKAQTCMTISQEMEQAGHLREASLLLERARQYDPSFNDVSHRLAVLYDLQGMVPEARAEYERALRDLPHDASLLNDYGYFHLRHDELSTAETYFRQALKSDPSCKQAAVNLASVLARQRHDEESLQAFTKALGPAAAHSNLGAILAKQGKTEQAKEHFREASRLDPSLSQPKAFLAYFERNPGGVPKAKAAPPKSDPAQPDSPAAAVSRDTARKASSS